MADDKKDNSYRPFLATDKEYLKKVAASMEAKTPIEEIKFNLLNEAIVALGFSNNPYELLDPDNLKMDSVQPIVDKTFETIQKGVSEEAKQKLYALWDYLCEADPLQKSDLIFVFGGGGETRPKEAARLYKSGWGSKILFVGHKASFMGDVEMTEAQAFAKIAEQEGVPVEDIILENESQNTVENATKSIAILKQRGELPQRIILIQIAYQMRRAYLTFKTAADWNPELIKYPARSAKYTREDYFTKKDGWTYVFFEFIKLYGARLMRHF